MKLTGSPLEDISEPIQELRESFNSQFVVQFGDGIGITQYVFWMIIILLIVVIGLLIPQGR